MENNLIPKIKSCMAQQGLSPNNKVLQIKSNQDDIGSQQVQRICEVFGTIEKIESKDKSYFVTYVNPSDAMIAKDTINDIKADELGYDITADWVINDEVSRVFEIIPTPNVFLPIPHKNNSSFKPDPPEYIKYIARFPITLQNSEDFHLYHKLLGAKGCNFRKIIERCTKDSGIPEKPKDLIKLKITKNEETEIKVTSKYLNKFNIACELLHELITLVFEEYKKYCETLGTNPSDLRIRKLQQIKGRARVFRERRENPLVYSISES
jgi:hypothetical protein